MRLWSLNPKYPDPKGLVALWREALPAQAVLQGKTAGYRAHPQLQRFRAQSSPVAAIGAYLLAVRWEADARSYSFDPTRIAVPMRHKPIPVTDGQIRFEWQHLMRKLSERNKEWPSRWNSVESPQCHPLFRIRQGGIETWERQKGSA